MSHLTHEMQYHMYRLGNRAQLAQLYGISKETLRDVYPVSDIDKYMSGQLISIGGILARKCICCNTAREINKFHSKSTNLSGCGNTCLDCITINRRVSKLREQYLAVRRNHEKSDSTS